MRLRVFLVLTLIAAQAHAADDPLLRKIASTPEYRLPTELRLLGPHLALSRPSKDAADYTDFDIVQLDLTDAAEKLLVEAERGASFVAADAKYIVHLRSGNNASRLIVRDRSTGEHRGSIRLREGASWGEIRGEQLLVLQDREAVFFTLPDLKVERTQLLESLAKETQAWNGHIVILTRSALRLYDSQLSRFTELPLPPAQPGERKDCQPGSLRIYQDLAILSSNCSRIAIYDLAQGKLVRVIAGFATQHTLAVIDGLLFAGATSPFEQHRTIRVYELATGREIARLATEARFLAAHAGKLLALHQEKYAGPGHFTVYEPDVRAIRSDPARQARLFAQCRAQDAGGLHRFIDACENAGVRGFLDASRMSPELGAVVDMYADALSRTLSRYDEAIAILERQDRTPQREAALKRSRRKASFLASGRSPGAAAMPGLRNATTELGGFGNLIAFESDHAYVARWRCSESDGGLNVDVLDRRTYAERKRLSVAPCDASYQDATSSITALRGGLLIEIGPNAAAVLDPGSQQIVARSRPSISAMRMGEWQGSLLHCGASENELDVRFDPATARLVAASEEESRACANGQVFRKNAAYDPVPGRSDLLAVTHGFRVHGGTEASYVRYVMRFTPTGEGEAFTRTMNYGPWKVHALADQDAVVYGIGVSFFHYDIPKRHERMLVALKPGAGYQDSLVWRHYLFVAVGRDLIVYDIARDLVAYYEKELVAAGCAPCGRDDRIFQLLLDEDRLIVLAKRGEPTRVIDLPQLVQGLDGRDFFATLAPE